MPSRAPFGPDSTIRAVNGEAIILLGAGRALLMQVAHPLVARGAAEHSSYRRDRLGRLLRTLRPMYAIAFGNAEEVHAAAERVNLVHRRVVGQGYSALDPELLLWVHATLVDSALELHARFVQPLSDEECERYYQDMKVVGRLLAVPSEVQPPDYAAFRRYLEATVETLEVSDAGRAIFHDLALPLPPVGPAALPLRWLTAGLLPRRLRGQYGLDWSPRREALLQGLQRLSRGVWPRLPGSIRRVPAPLLPPSARPRYASSPLGWWKQSATATLSGAPASMTAAIRSST